MDRRRRWWPAWLDPVLVFTAALAGVVAYMLVTNAAHYSSEHDLRVQAQADLQCIANYENATRARMVVLTDLSTARSVAEREVQDALRAITTASTDKKPVSPAAGRALIVALDRATAAYQKADDAYNTALRKNPLPPPVFTCSDRLHTKATATVTPSSAPVVTYTAVSTAPGSTTTRTYTVTVPQPYPVPSGVRTVIVTQTVQRGHGK